MNVFASKKGSAMVMAIIIIAVASVLITGLFAYASTDALQLDYNQKLKQAEYLARSAVEATSKAYEELNETKKLTGTDSMTTSYVYMLNDGSYFTYDPTNPMLHIPDPDAIRGYYIVTVTAGVAQNLNGTVINNTVEFSAVATSGGTTSIKADGTPDNVDGVSSIAAAFIIPATTTDSVMLYDENTGVANVDNTIMTKNASAIHVTSLFGNGQTYDLWSYSSSSSLIFNQADASKPKIFRLPDNNSINKVAYAAPTIIFNMPVDMTPRTNDRQALLILCGKDIVINGDIELYAYKSLIFNRVGTLLLMLPDSSSTGHAWYEDSDGSRYGKVYFNGDVYVTVRSLFSGDKRAKAFSAGSVYKFRDFTANGKTIGIDLLKYAVDNGDATISRYASFLENLYGPEYNYKETVGAKQYMELVNDPSELQMPDTESVNALYWK